jgi:hypothetical protein
VLWIERRPKESVILRISLIFFKKKIFEIREIDLMFLWIYPESMVLLFTILRPFGIRESIRRKVDHGGQIVLWYWQHATNLARATMFEARLAIHVHCNGVIIFCNQNNYYLNTFF